MQIEIKGSGPDLVLLHGWAMHSGIFQPLVKQLEHNFTLHLVDLPGHGRSRDSRNELDLLDCAKYLQQHLPRALILGWSLGGLLALQMAKVFNQQCRGLILIAASPRFVIADDWSHGMPVSVFDNFATELQLNWKQTLDRFLMLEVQGSDHLREELRFLREHLFEHGEPSPQVLRKGLEILSQSDLRAALPQLGVPNLWLAGRRDKLVAAAAMRAASAQTPLSCFVEIEGAGHAPFITHANVVANHICAFSEQLAP